MSFLIMVDSDFTVNEDVVVAFGSLYTPPFITGHVVDHFAFEDFQIFVVVNHYIGGRAFSQHTAIIKTRKRSWQRT